MNGRFCLLRREMGATEDCEEGCEQYWGNSSYFGCPTISEGEVSFPTPIGVKDDDFALALLKRLYGVEEGQQGSGELAERKE